MIFNINIDTINIESPFPQQCSRHVTYHLTTHKQPNTIIAQTCFALFDPRNTMLVYGISNSRVSVLLSVTSFFCIERLNGSSFILTQMLLSTYSRTLCCSEIHISPELRAFCPELCRTCPKIWTRKNFVTERRPSQVLSTVD